MPPSRVLLTANNLNVGGPSKMMLGLLENLDPRRFSVSIAALSGGALADELAARASVWLAPPSLAALQVRKDRLPADIGAMIASGHGPAAVELALAPVRALRGRSMTIQRQHLWRDAAGWASRMHVPGEFDLAFSLASGLSRYMTIDCVDARRRALWIMSDYAALESDDQVEAEYVRRYDAALTISRVCQANLERAVGSFPGEVELLPAAIPWGFYAASSARPVEFDAVRGAVLLTVARLEEGKGLHLALDAAAQLRTRGFAFDWFVLGDGSARSSLQAQAVRLGVEDCMHFLGFRPNVPDYLRGCDLVIHPSLSEGRSVAVDEALALGKWVVATAYPTVSEQIQAGANGAVAGFSGQEIADAIIQNLGKSTPPASRSEQREEINALFRRLVG